MNYLITFIIVMTATIILTLYARERDLVRKTNEHNTSKTRIKVQERKTSFKTDRAYIPQYLNDEGVWTTIEAYDQRLTADRIDKKYSNDDYELATAKATIDMHNYILEQKNAPLNVSYIKHP